MRRIIARLTQATARKLVEMVRAAGCSIAKIIAESIYAYRSRSGNKRRTALEVFEATGFIGCGRGNRQLSVCYKSYLTKSLGKKV